MQAVGVVFHPIQDRAALFIVGDIGGQPVQFALGKLVGKLIARLRQGIGIARHHQQVGTEAEQLARDGKTNPGTGAGDEGGLSIQPPTVRCHVVILFKAQETAAATQLTRMRGPGVRACCAR